MAQPLTRRELEVLAFERQWFRVPGAKEEAIRQLFELTPVRYYQLLHALIDRPEAEAAAPGIVRKLRRVRAARCRRHRSALRSPPD